MTGKIIQYNIVKKQFSTFVSLHSTLLQSCHKGRLPDNSFQVVYCSARHWILASNKDCTKGVVNIYNSLFTSLDEETLATVNSYFGEKGSKRKVQYRMQEVQKQIGTKNCGVFAIAFLTSLAYNQDQDQLRRHLCDYLMRGKLAPFPSTL